MTGVEEITQERKEQIEKHCWRKMTHPDLIPIAYRFVTTKRACGVAFKEMYTVAGEYPDVIGFGSHGHSVLIECKTNRKDFSKDKTKPFRKDPLKGMGKQRFYLCPVGVLSISDLPDGWGLLYVSTRGLVSIIHDPYGGRIKWHETGFHERNHQAEKAIMYSALRRLQVKGHKL